MFNPRRMGFADPDCACTECKARKKVQDYTGEKPLPSPPTPVEDAADIDWDAYTGLPKRKRDQL